MQIAGLERLTLLDFPQKIACVIFTQGCNMACPFCHNCDILNVNKIGEIEEKSFFDFLERRVGKLEGVVISGGEPTLQKDLLEFIKKIKDMGFLVKLDSNGYKPKVLKKILDTKLVDYVAMDIKHSFEKYHLAFGKKIDCNKIAESVQIIINSGIDYEFRTTCVPGIHKEEDFYEIAKIIKGAKKYYLQEFRPEKVLDEKLKIVYKKNQLNLQKIKNEIQKEIPETTIRFA